MANQAYRINRTQYWYTLPVLLALKFGAASFGATQFGDGGIWRAIDTGLAMGIAMTIGGRFLDGGWPRWLGILLTVMIMFIFPLAAFFTVVPKGDDALQDFFDSVGGMSSLLLFILIAVAGLRATRW